MTRKRKTKKSKLRTPTPLALTQSCPTMAVGKMLPQAPIAPGTIQ